MKHPPPPPPSCGGKCARCPAAQQIVKSFESECRKYFFVEKLEVGAKFLQRISEALAKKMTLLKENENYVPKELPQTRELFHIFPISLQP